jgi:hypothetical protein
MSWALRKLTDEVNAANLDRSPQGWHSRHSAVEG